MLIGLHKRPGNQVPLNLFAVVAIEHRRQLIELALLNWRVIAQRKITQPCAMMNLPASVSKLNSRANSLQDMVIQHWLFGNSEFHERTGEEHCGNRYGLAMRFA